MKTIKVYCGRTINQTMYPAHPVDEVYRAKFIIDQIKNGNEHIPLEWYSHHPDFVSAMCYIGRKEGVNVEFYLDGKFLGNDIEEIFLDFNEAFKLIDELGDLGNEESI